MGREMIKDKLRRRRGGGSCKQMMWVSLSLSLAPPWWYEWYITQVLYFLADLVTYEKKFLLFGYLFRDMRGKKVLNEEMETHVVVSHSDVRHFIFLLVCFSFVYATVDSKRVESLYYLLNRSGVMKRMLWTVKHELTEV